MPIASLSTLATGARQLVVHDALDTMSWPPTELVVVDAEHDGQSTPLAGAEISTFFAPRVEMLLRALAVSEEAGAFEHDVDAELGVRQVGGVALGGDADALAVDDQVIALGRDLARIFAVHRVAREQPGVGLGIGKVVDRDEFKSIIATLQYPRGATRRPIRPKPLIATFTVIANTSVAENQRARR